ncbi:MULTISPECIES: YgjP family zinc-dependent metalloprotease [Heyndrickxia]|uniref:YgjP family zinc-dependent metalloprotease n=1 Tax=Heyndrickxia TaxID=2837504 RepID=UPI001B3A76FC|nr:MULTISPECIES: SprT family zinc-dependent metalloprotease [Heyndrickxia]MBQ4911701.1 M48 family metallopeptidase [Heyndrickxia faecalis]MED4891036.1 SprT family zinc-dependent metalloprotease [Weizmannia sp. CD-2023]MED4921471.1 SprT family zinc-dependent metalloprotease [Weizmannia sp. CD-2023]
MEKHQIEYANKIIDFVVKRKKVKNVNLNIKPDMTIEVTANDRVPLDFICDFVKTKGAWILKNVKTFQDIQPYRQSEREYVSGETFKYLGKQYRLRVMQEEEEKVKYFRGFIYLYVKDTENVNRKAKLIDEWYREKAQKTFHESLAKMFPLVQKYGVDKPNMDLRSMKARWGSALTEKNTILLNTDLIKAPKYCIDYVVLHELIHFKYNDHSDNFYKMLYSLMPDWEKRKAILDEEVVKDL